jgi:hypothetical protein
MAEGRKWHAHTTERIKNLRPLAVMRANVYRKTVGATGFRRDIL